MISQQFHVVAWLWHLNYLREQGVLFSLSRIMRDNRSRVEYLLYLSLYQLIKGSVSKVESGLY